MSIRRVFLGRGRLRVAFGFPTQKGVYFRYQQKVVSV